MTVFAILLPEPNPAIVGNINSTYVNNIYKLSDTQWFVSTSDTMYEVSARIKVYDLNTPQAESLGNAVIFPVSSYYGKTQSTLWDWLKTKLEARQSA